MYLKNWKHFEMCNEEEYLYVYVHIIYAFI